jgi:DNA-binding CsgD family transcriptional regulator
LTLTSTPDVLRIAATGYDAAADPTAWPAFLESFAAAIGADITFIQRHYFAEQRSSILRGFGLTERHTGAYNRHYSRVNVWRAHGHHLYRGGGIVFDEQLYPRDLLKRTEFYNDCLIPNGGTHSMAGVISRRGDEALVVVGLKADSREQFGKHEGQLVTELLPHLARAQMVQERLELLEAGEAVLDALAQGTVVLAANGSVVFCNRSAEAILRAGDGLSLRNRRVAASNAETTAALQNLVRSAISFEPAAACPTDIVVARPSGRRPYHVSAAPLRRRVRPLMSTNAPAALLVIVDPEQHRYAPSSGLRHAYGLTAKEAALAMALADGSTLEQAASQLGIRYETARTHMRRIFSKTQTSRQAQLVLLVNRISQQTVIVGRAE